MGGEVEVSAVQTEASADLLTVLVTCTRIPLPPGGSAGVIAPIIIPVVASTQIATKEVLKFACLLQISFSFPSF